MAVCETHCEPSLPLRPTRVFPVTPTAPNQPPATVCLDDPVAAATLDGRIALGTPRSNDTPYVTVPSCIPTDIAARLLLATPWLDRTANAVSEVQDDASAVLLPSLLAPVFLISPIPCPTRVILWDPEATTFKRVETLTAADAKETAIDKLPPISPTVISTTLLLPIPRLCRHDVALSEIHTLDSL